jgi:hypothetical protein
MTDVICRKREFIIADTRKVSTPTRGFFRQINHAGMSASQIEKAESVTLATIACTVIAEKWANRDVRGLTA